MGVSKKKIKGFTLIELIVVLAIIVILSSILSVVVSGLRKSSQMEVNNTKAQEVFTAFQDILIQCEIKQDQSIFEPRENRGGDVEGVVLFFRISDKDVNGNAYSGGSVRLGDEIHLMTVYDTSSPLDDGSLPIANCTTGSVYSEDISAAALAVIPSGAVVEPNYAHSLYNRLNSAIEGRIDPSMTGTYCVMIDYANYEVRSVICRDLLDGKDPKTGLYDASEVGAGGVALGNYITHGDNSITPVGGSPVDLPCRMFFVKDSDEQNRIYKQTGVIVGCYPFLDNAYTSIS